MGWWIALGVVTVLAVLPLGVSVRYNSDGALVKVIAGPVSFTVFPRPKREKKKTKEPEKNKPRDAQEENLPKPPQPPKQEKPSQKKKKETGGSLRDFLPLVKLALHFLGDFRRKLRVNMLQLNLILAADDPCNLAVNYGRAWAAVGNLMPRLERLFVIRKQDVQIQCDFTASEILVIARLDLTITLGRLLALVVVYGIRALKEFLNLQKKRKGGAVL